jgi:hypothetical protein
MVSGQYMYTKYVQSRLNIQRTLKNSPRVELYGLHGLPLTYFWSVLSMGRCIGKTKTIIYQIFCEPESQNLEHTAYLIVGCPDARSMTCEQDRSCISNVETPT